MFDPELVERCQRASFTPYKVFVFDSNADISGNVSNRCLQSKGETRLNGRVNRAKLQYQTSYHKTHPTTDYSMTPPQTSNEVDRSLTHAFCLVDSISYVASLSKKSSKLGLKMVLHAGAIRAVYIIQMSMDPSQKIFQTPVACQHKKIKQTSVVNNKAGIFAHFSWQNTY